MCRKRLGSHHEKRAYGGTNVKDQALAARISALNDKVAGESDDHEKEDLFPRSNEDKKPSALNMTTNPGQMMFAHLLK